MRERAEENLAEQRWAWLRERFRTSRESQALVRVLDGHTDRVRGVAVTSDGRFAVSASDDRTLKVWDVATGRSLITLETSAPLKCCAISPDGKTLLAGLKTTVFDLITWAESQGRVAELVEGARAANAGNPALRAFAAAYPPPAPPPVAPSRVPGRTSLPHETLLGVHAAAVRAGLNQVRGALFGGIDTALMAALPGSNNPAGQLLTDLDELNKLGRVPDGSVPLATWLTNALALVGPRREAGVFQDALAALSM